MTRMWMLDPTKLCRQHLLGEHKELHQLVGTINKRKWKHIEGHALLKQVDTSLIIPRHDELVTEMLRRGYNHHSPLPSFPEVYISSIDPIANLADLCKRCSSCRNNFEQPILP